MSTRYLRWWLPLAIAALAGGAAYVGQKATTASETAARPRPQVSVSSSVLDFGSTALHTPVVRQLLLRNDGEAPVVAVLSVEATSSGTSFATDVTRLTLLPARSSRIPVRLDASRPGEFVDRLRISFPDGLDPLLIELRGQAFSGPSARVAGRSGPDGVQEQARPLTDADPPSAETGEPPLDAERLRNQQAYARGRNVASAGSSRSRAGGAVGPLDSGGWQQRPQGGAEGRGVPDGAGAARIYAFDPRTSAPVTDITTPPSAVSDRITPAEQASAHPLNEGVPDELDAPEEDDNSAKADPPKSNPKQPDKPATPTFTVSGLSAVTLLGTSVRFSPQGITVKGANDGGMISLSQLIKFPIVPLAFGESMLISQAGAGSGEFEPSTGSFKLRLPLVIVDSDGDAAPVLIELTTGTSYGKNDSGIVVSLSGSPRTPGSGWLKLVGLQKIPVGYRNGAEDNLVTFEILGQLSLNDGATSSL